MINPTGRLNNTLSVSFLLVIVLTTGLASPTVGLELNPVGASQAFTPTSIVRIWLNGDVVGDHPGWNDSSPGPTITVTSGVTVNLMLNATDILTHNWFIDTQKNFTPDPNGISSPDFSFSATRMLNFTFTPVIGQNIPAAGNWTYRCKYHPFPYMYGTIRILQGPDFTISASPTELTTIAETTTTAIISVNPTASFIGTVYLTAIGTNNLQTTISPATINPNSETSTLTILAPSAGNYTATITATSGPLTHSLNLTIQATDFTINADPDTATARVNTQTTTTITIEAVNHFSGTVALSLDNTFCALSQNSITGSGNVTLSCKFTQTGQFTVQIVGTSRSTSNTATIVFSVTHPGHHKTHTHNDHMINPANLTS